MIKKVRARRRRMLAAVAGIAAAVILVISGVAVAAGLLPLRPGGPQRIAFSPVVPSGITAIADVVPVNDGTDIQVECVYAEVNDPRPGGGHENYSIFVVDRVRPRLGDQGMARNTEQADASSRHDATEGLADRRSRDQAVGYQRGPAARSAPVARRRSRAAVRTASGSQPREISALSGKSLTERPAWS